MEARVRRKWTFSLLIMMGWVLLAGFKDQFVQKLVDSKESHSPLPNVSQYEQVDFSAAYDIQTAFVKRRLSHEHIAGFKAGLTTGDTQAYLGITRPVFGVLFKSGDFTHKKHISLKQTHRLMLEMELGYITKKRITHTVESVEALREYIGQVVPVVELPDIGFVAQPMTALDLIAGNTGSYGYIVHRGMNWIHADVNNITASLYRNDTMLVQGQSLGAMGDQWEALRWLINQIIAHGWTVEKNQLLITGSLCELVPANPGAYVAKFNDHAELKFTITL